MKTVEIFIDESGDILRHKPLNLTGIAVLAPDHDLRERFHLELFERLKTEGLTSGVCDGTAPNDTDRMATANRIAEELEAPEWFLPKRAEGDNWDFHWSEVCRLASTAQEVAAASRVTMLAFSLRFPNSSARRWSAPDTSTNLLLDRPYGECLKDVLELLLFETPLINEAIAAGASLSLDLPTRSLGAPVPATGQDAQVGSMWSEWGVDSRAERNRETGEPEVVSSSLDPGDAIEILTGALNRRPHRGTDLRIDRARCCKLIDWERWRASAAPDRRKKNYWAMYSSPRPRQIHFLADFLASGIFQERVELEQAPFRIWLDRGFELSSVDQQADRWLSATRAFANGDRSGALRTVATITSQAGHQTTKTYGFFRQRAGEWPDQLTAQDLSSLFASI